MCEFCSDDKFVVVMRDDDLLAVEKCPGCSDDNETDTDAAHRAQAHAVDCRINYPCYIEPSSRVIDEYTLLRRGVEGEGNLQKLKRAERLFYMLHQMDWLKSHGYTMRSYCQDTGFNGKLWDDFETFCGKDGKLKNERWACSTLQPPDFSRWMNYRDRNFHYM